MSPVQLAALLANTEAEILQHSRAAAQGIVVWLDDLDVVVDERNAMCKSRFLAIPGRLAQLVSIASVEEVRTRLSREVEGALANLTPKEPQ